MIPIAAGNKHARIDAAGFAAGIASQFYSSGILDGWINSGVFLFAEDIAIIEEVLRSLALVLRSERVGVVRACARDLARDDGYDRLIYDIEGVHGHQEAKRSPTIVDAIQKVVHDDDSVLAVLISEVQELGSTTNGFRVLAGLKSARDAVNISTDKGSFFLVAGGTPPSDVQILVTDSRQPFFGAIAMSCDEVRATQHSSP